MMKKITLLFAASVISIAIQAQSFTATYTFDSVKTTSGLTDPTAVPMATGITFGSFTATSTHTNPNAAGRFSFTGWSTGATTANDVYSSYTGSLDPLNYYEVTLTPAPNYTMDLTSITFAMRRSGTGPRTYSVRSSADAYAANLPASIVPANINLSVQAGDIFFWNYDTTATNKNQGGSKLTLSGASFTGVSSPLSFRFYGWNAEASGGSFSIDTVSFSGLTALGNSINLSSETVTSIFPNPSLNGLFTIDLGAVSSKTNIIVYNIIGKVILEKEVVSSTKQTIDLSNESAGSYFVNIKNNNGSITRKISVYK